ncbi:MAG: aminotransferase class V-fold PLP-dependent enzyme [Clostridiales bacterium]|nr:aminotransferase class V-fold PLP-dependent enzyme [Clostridiales bacterium]
MYNLYAATNDIRSRILGLDVLVKLKSGREVPAINLDNAATTPAFKEAADSVREKLMYYGSIGRGKGQKSEISSQIYEDGRDVIKNFVGANSDKYEVFYVNCTTDGMNKLASALITSHRDIVLTTRMEHHANDLPWRERCRTVYAEVDSFGRLCTDDFAKLLEEYGGRIKYVCVSAASNVTGYVNDVHKIAKTAHLFGAKIVVDGAQIVAHREFSMLGTQGENDDIDYFVFSAHKMYSPFGGGAVVGLKEELNSKLPVFYGGGMVDKVTDNDVIYSEVPDRYEAGSPNYPGVVGMLKAIELLQKIGFDFIREHEQILLRRAIDKLRYEIPSVILYGDCENIADRVGILPFNLKLLENDEVADKLAENAAIAVRHAKFCSHTYVDRLLGLSPNPEERIANKTGCVHEGMVRVSFGIYNTEKDVDALVAALTEMLRGDYVTAFAEGRVKALSDTVKAGRRMPNDRG